MSNPTTFRPAVFGSIAVTFDSFDGLQRNWAGYDDLGHVLHQIAMRVPDLQQRARLQSAAAVLSQIGETITLTGV